MKKEKERGKREREIGGEIKGKWPKGRDRRKTNVRWRERDGKRK